MKITKVKAELHIQDGISAAKRRSISELLKAHKSVNAQGYHDEDKKIIMLLDVPDSGGAFLEEHVSELIRKIISEEGWDCVKDWRYTDAAGNPNVFHP